MNTEIQIATKEEGANLRREVRASIASGDADRNAQAQADYSQWNDKWKDENAEAIAEAKQKHKAKDEATIDDQADIDEVASQSIKAAGVLLGLEEKSRKKDAKIVDLSEARQKAEHTTRKTEAEKVQIAADAETQRQRANRAEAGQTPRGVPFDETTLATKPDGYEFTPADFCEALKREKEHAPAIRRALANWDDGKGKATKRGSRWALTRDEAEAFWKSQHHRRHKAHPPRLKNKIAHK